jgi:hypothetical protein
VSNIEIQENYLSFKYVSDVYFHLQDGTLDIRTRCLCTERLIIVCSHCCIDVNS